MELHLLPRPRELTVHEGAFALDASCRLAIAPGNEAALATARGLQAALRELFDMAVPVVPVAGVKPHALRIGQAEASNPAELGAQAYTLAVVPGGVETRANDAAGLFYGVQTLIQLARACGRRLPALAIRDWPALPTRGYLLDVTRGKVPKPETLERFVRTIAHHKANHLQLYTEHAFDFPSHPDIGRGTGALTPDDVLRLDELCRAHHIELAANFQAMGHQGRLLKLPQYQHLAETPWRFTFATDNDEVFALVGELLDDLLPCFSSNLVNVNADEPWDLGRGQSKAMTERLGLTGVYLQHLQRLHELIAARGRRMAMWADVIKHHPERIGELPEDVLLIDWQYEALDRYDTLDALAASGREFWVCPATSSWLALYPRLGNAIRNIRDFIAQGIAAGATGAIVSDWGDNGHDQALSNGWYPFLWGAECAWTGSATPLEDFEVALGVQVLGDRSGRLSPALRRLGEAMQTEPVWNPSWNTAMALYEDPLVGKVHEVAGPAVTAEARAAAEAVAAMVPGIPDPVMRADLGFATHEIAFVCDKVETTRAIRALLRELASTPAGNGAHASLGELIERVESHRARVVAIREEFARRWMATSRRSDLSFNLARFDALLARYDAAIAWLRHQEERIARGGAPDAALATYDRGGYAVLHEATYVSVKELADIVGIGALPDDLKQYLRDIEEK